MLSNLQGDVIWALAQHPAGATAEQVAADIDRRVSQARRTLDALTAAIRNPSPGHAANRPALVVFTGGVYQLTPAGVAASVQ